MSLLTVVVLAAVLGIVTLFVFVLWLIPRSNANDDSTHGDGLDGMSDGVETLD